MLNKITHKLRKAAQRFRYYLHRWYRPALPPHNVSWLPDGFTVRRLASTGISVVENFCTASEAEAVIEAAKDGMQRSGVYIDGEFRDHDGRISYTSLLYGRGRRHASVHPLMLRAAMLTGMPYTHIEAVYVTRYPEGGLYNEHFDHGDSFATDRLYTVLLYLNTVPEEQGGATAFPSLDVEVTPAVGRAVTWTNLNPDGSGHQENSHTTLPVKNGGEKWVIQFWIRAYPMVPKVNELALPQSATGLALGADDELLDGVRRHARPSSEG